VVDLGCGAGVPSTALLAKRHRVVGIDISAAQLGLARGRVPTALLVRADLSEVALAAGHADAVTAFYSMGHVPRRLHAGVLAEVFQALRPGGWLLTTMSVGGTEDTVQADFLGVPMFFSGFDAETNKTLILKAGFRIDTADAVSMREPEGEARFLWVLAQRPPPMTSVPLGRRNADGCDEPHEHHGEEEE